MLDKAGIIPKLLQRIERLPSGDCIDVCSYKRDRSLLIIKCNDNEIRIIENGFEKSDTRIRQEAWKNALKTLIKREFPRSNKLRLYNMGVYTAQQINTNNRKRI